MIHFRHGQISIIFSIAVAGVLIFSGLWFTAQGAQAQGTGSITACTTDIDFDGITDITDYSILVATFFKEPITPPEADITQDGVVDVQDYSALVTYFLVECPEHQNEPTAAVSVTPGPTAPPQSADDEWTQFGHNAQRTNATAQTVNTPWKLAWMWNSSGSDGKTQSNHLSVPNFVQPITGNNRVYMVASNSVFAFQQQNGTQLWTKSGFGTLSSTPVYADEYLYVASENGNVYKLSAGNGQTVATYSSGGSIALSPLYTGTQLIVVTKAGQLIAVDPSSMAEQWRYSGNSPGSTPASYSPSKSTVIYVTQDLNVHAVNSTNGQSRWVKKPTTRSYTTANAETNWTTAEDGWPVIAEQHGVVFVRYRLEWNTLWTANPFPNTNAEIRSLLTNNSGDQALFAMNLSDGSRAFVPAVGNGGHGDGGNLPMGPQPLVSIKDGKEVAYMVWRNGQVCANSSWCDGREDATIGEMVLDSSTVSGYQPGDLRFVNFIDIQTDEMMNLTMSGDTVFHSHWLINAAERMTDRSAGKGGSFSNPISTTHMPYLIWRQCYCPPDNPNCNPKTYPGGSGAGGCGNNCAFTSSHYCNGGLYSWGDERSYPAGFFEYHNERPEVSRSEPFTIVSNNTVIVKTYNAGLMVFTNGSPGANASTQSKVAGVAVAKGDTSEIPVIDYRSALSFVDRVVTVKGVIRSVENHRPKAMYLGFNDPHDGALLVRIFEKDLSKFNYSLEDLKNKNVKVTGRVSLYWPEGIDPEIIVTDPGQLEIVE